MNHTSQFENLLQSYSNLKKVGWDWHKEKHREKVKSQEINTYIYDQLIFNKDVKTIEWRKNSLLSKWCCDNWVASCKGIKLDLYLTLDTKINSKWIQDLVS